MAHIRLGELLVKAGYLSEKALARALEEQKKWGGRLGRILREMSLVTEEVLLKALTKQLRLPRADLSAPEIPPSILSQIDPRFALENRLCPERFDAQARTLVVAVEDHLSLGALDEIRATTGLRVKTSLAPIAEINAAIAKLYPSDPISKSPEGGRGAMFETKDFVRAASQTGVEEPRLSSLRLLETKDFSQSASKVRQDEDKTRSD